MRIPLQTAVEVSDWPCSTSHDPHSGLGMVLGMLAVLGLSSVTLILFLWQGATSFTSHRMFPEEVPSWSWETLKGDAEQQNNSCSSLWKASPRTCHLQLAAPLPSPWPRLGCSFLTLLGRASTLPRTTGPSLDWTLESMTRLLGRERPFYRSSNSFFSGTSLWWWPPTAQHWPRHPLTSRSWLPMVPRYDKCP